jgi:hypothetical protein
VPVQILLGEPIRDFVLRKLTLRPPPVTDNAHVENVVYVLICQFTQTLDDLLNHQLRDLPPESSFSSSRVNRLSHASDGGSSHPQAMRAQKEVEQQFGSRVHLHPDGQS